MEFKEFEPQFKSAKIRQNPRVKFSAGLNLETFKPGLKFKPPLKFFKFGQWSSLKKSKATLLC